MPSLNRGLSVGRSLILALVVGALTFWLTGGPLAGLELTAYDLLFRVRGPLADDSAVAIVAIDDASFNATELQWPWPRDYLAEVVSAVASGEPEVIAIDVFFYESSDPDADAALAEAIDAAGNVVLTNDITFQSEDRFAAAQLNRPILAFDQAAAAVGLANFPRDRDGAVRRLLAFQQHNDQYHFSWALQAIRLYLGQETFTINSADELHIGGQRVALQSHMLLVNYGGPANSIPTYSAYQVADGTVNPQVFSGKIVMIGATSESLHDTYPTPYGSQPTMPGVEINAHAVDTILSDRFIRPTTEASRLALAMLAALAGMAVASQLRPLTGLAAAAGLVLGYAALSVIVFNRFNTVLPLATPLLATGLTYVVGTSVQLVEERRAKAHIRSLFDRYVSPAAIDQMLSSPEGFAGEQRREVTILFSDIRGFTSISEQLAPGEVVAILNEYLSAMTEIIFKYEGAIDKFEGDAILAVFNAPLPVTDHPSKAVLCAVEMMRRLTEMQATWTATGQHVLEIGIGINTGQAFVGNIGSAQRMDYTVIGDVVNLASRLQDLTKEHGIPILFGESTRERLAPGIRVREVATAQVKGRQQLVTVYTVEAAL